MSRSFHANRSWRYIQKLGDLDSEAVEEIWKKRQIKRQVRRERVSKQNTGVSPSPLGAVPIIVDDDGMNVLYPASSEDLRLVLEQMEAPELEGVHSIRMSLGLSAQEEVQSQFESEGFVVRDPVFGRLGYLLTEGLFAPLVRGTYDGSSGEIKLYAYITTDAFQPDPLECFGLQIHFVRTFLHELAHHHQYRTAAQRGRLVSQLNERLEGEAMALSDQWFKNRITPVLKQWAAAVPDETT